MREPNLPAELDFTDPSSLFSGKRRFWSAIEVDWEAGMDKSGWFGRGHHSYPGWQQVDVSTPGISRPSIWAISLVLVSCTPLPLMVFWLKMIEGVPKASRWSKSELFSWPKAFSAGLLIRSGNFDGGEGEVSGPRLTPFSSSQARAAFGQTIYQS